MSQGKKDGGKGFKVVDRRYWAREDDDEGEVETGTPIFESSEVPASSSDRIDELTRQLAAKDRMLAEILATHQQSLSDLDSARVRIRREVGKEAEFDVAYGALLKAMTSPYVEKVYCRGSFATIRGQRSLSRHRQRHPRAYGILGKPSRRDIPC